MIVIIFNFVPCYVKSTVPTNKVNNKTRQNFALGKLLSKACHYKIKLDLP